jgi:hypothetical protein
MSSRSGELLDHGLDFFTRGDNRAFGPLIKVPASATPTERFIAWAGRRPPGVPPDVRV